MYSCYETFWRIFGSFVAHWIEFWEIFNVIKNTSNILVLFEALCRSVDSILNEKPKAFLWNTTIFTPNNVERKTNSIAINGFFIWQGKIRFQYSTEFFIYTIYIQCIVYIIHTMIRTRPQDAYSLLFISLFCLDFLRIFRIEKLLLLRAARDTEK